MPFSDRKWLRAEIKFPKVGTLAIRLHQLSFNIIRPPHQPHLILHSTAVCQHAVFANLKIYILQDLCPVDSLLSFLLMPSSCMQFGGFA